MLLVIEILDLYRSTCGMHPQVRITGTQKKTSVTLLYKKLWEPFLKEPAMVSTVPNKRAINNNIHNFHCSCIPWDRPENTDWSSWESCWPSSWLSCWWGWRWRPQWGSPEGDLRRATVLCRSSLTVIIFAGVNIQKNFPNFGMSRLARCPLVEEY